VKINEDRWQTFKRTVVERNSIYIKKEILLQDPPWTKDSILSVYRFCNVFRDLDKVYRLLSAIPRNANSPYYWALRLMLRWSSSEALIKETTSGPYMERLLKGVSSGIEDYIVWATRDFKGPMVTGSFIVKRPGGKEGDRFMLSTYYREIAELNIPSWKGKTIKECGKKLRSVLPWCGSFTSYCILSDLMYEDGPLTDAPDLYTYAEKGPGGIRGMAHLYGVDPSYITTQVWERSIKELVERWTKDGMDMAMEVRRITGVATTLEVKIIKPMALDVEHWLCEYYKYARGSAKRRYKAKGVNA